VLAEKGLHDGRNRLARDTHNADCAAPRRGGNSDNRIVVAGEHGVYFVANMRTKRRHQLKGPRSGPFFI
jgi:hypothetical protein